MDDVFSIFQNTEYAGDCFVETTRESLVEYEANECRGYTVREDKGFGLRLINRSGKMGFFSSNDFSAWPQAAERAEAISHYGNEAGLEIPSYRVADRPWENRVDQRLTDMSPEGLMEIGNYLISRIRDEFPEVLTNLTVTVGQQDKQLVNHRAESVKHGRSFFSLAVEINQTRDQDILEISNEYSWGNRDVNLEEVLNEVFLDLEHAQSIVSMESGEYPVLFTPHGSMVLLYSLLYGLNGKNIVHQRSPLVNRLHEGFFSPLLTIKEINHEPWALGSAPYDDEGIRTSPERMIIEKGRLEQYFLDLWSAGQIGLPVSPGGYRTSYRELPEAGFGNLLMESGLRDRETLVEEIDQGLIVDSVLGLGQSNVGGGHFSCNVQLGFLVKQGQIRGRVKDLMISGNAYEGLRNIKEISRDTRWVHGRLLLPYLLVEPVRIDSSFR